MKQANRMISMVLVLCVVLGILSGAASAAGRAVPFEDVRLLDWYYTAVRYVYEAGMMRGTGADRFAPETEATRGMVVTVLHRLEGEPEEAWMVFEDVAADAYYTEAVAWAGAEGIVQGYGDGRFAPDAPVTREQLAVMLHRYAQYRGENTEAVYDLRFYKDYEQLSQWALEAMPWAVGEKLISGTADGIMSPKGTLTRAQLAVLMRRLCEDVLTACAPAETEPKAGEDLCTVSFDLNFSGAVDAPDMQTVKTGETAQSPTEPQRDGYLFAGWTLDKNETDWLKVFRVETTPIEQDTVLFALWVDISTDSDADSLADELEDRLGTDKYNADSDGDGLPDYMEQVLLEYDPAGADSDGDGLRDSQEDYDGDGLSNEEELALGTEPVALDTDKDGLTDGEEVKQAGTDPQKKDTDGDGAGDADELRIGSDPLHAQTQFVERLSLGELSGERHITAEITTTVTGAQVGKLTISSVTGEENPGISPLIPGYLDEAVSVDTEGDFRSAELVIRFDETIQKQDEDVQPRIYEYDEETRTLEEVAGQEVKEGHILAVIERPSIYVLMDKAKFSQVWREGIKKPIVDGSGAIASIDVAFAIDVSGSMRNSRISTAKKALNTFIGVLGDRDRAALVQFHSSAKLLSDLTTDKEAVEEKVASLSADGKTAMYRGFEDALSQLTDSSKTYGYRMVVLLSDGRDEPDSDYERNYAALVKTAAAHDIVVYTIGIGDRVDTSVLKRIAEDTEGLYFHASEASELTEIFRSLQKETVDLTADENGDGIPDYYSELIRTGEMVLSNGSKEYMGVDFNYDEDGVLSLDYDGDGVKNGDELLIMERGDRVYLYKKSDPKMQYSDSDPYDDFLEHQNGTDPLIPSYLAECVDETWEDSNFTYMRVFQKEDEFWNEGARQIWSTVTFNWSHVDEAKATLASFFQSYANLRYVEDKTQEIELEVANQLGESILDQLVDYYKKGAISLEAFEDGASVVKKWIAAGNSAKNIQKEHFSKLKAQLGQFKRKFNFGSFRFKARSKVDNVGTGLSIVIDQSTDIYQWVKAYAALTATQAAFEESRDILELMVENDNSREKFVTRAAEEILQMLNEEEAKFKQGKYGDITLKTVENAASLAASLLSAANPFVCAANLIVGVAEVTLPGTTIAEASYQLYVVDELVAASKRLFHYTSKSESGFYYDLTDSQTRHIKLLIHARMFGGELAKTVTGNQLYWGMNDAEARQQYADAIDRENKVLESYLKSYMD